MSGLLTDMPLSARQCSLLLPVAIRAASALVAAAVLSIGCHAIEPLLAHSPGSMLSILWVLLSGGIALFTIIVTENLVRAIRSDARTNLHLAGGFLLVQILFGIVVAYRFDGLSQVFGLFAAIMALVAWLLARRVAGTIG